MAHHPFLAVSRRSTFLAVMALATSAAVAQSTSAPAAPEKPPLKQEELEQLLAPIALYPDSLLSQVFMASTYPIEVVQADRWAKQNKALKGDALAAALEKETWDPAVKSLINFPQVLAMMSEKLELTIKLGDAFLAQQADVMKTVQKLRAKAQAEGNLKSNEQQIVKVEAPPPQQTTVVVEQAAAPPPQVITIQPANPQVVYVPTYSPTVVYGAWPYPAYPPAPYYPPGYVASNMISFGAGVAVGAAWGYAWGNCNWGGNDVDIDVDRNTNINNNIDRSKYKSEIQNRQSNREGNRTGSRNSWQHNPSHRQGVPYRDQRTAQTMGADRQSRQAVQSRDAYRGRAEAGRQDIARGGADQYRGNGTGAGANRAGAGTANRAGAGNTGQNRTGSAAQQRSGSSANQRSSGGSAFGGSSQSGSSARAASQRGSSSRAGSPSRAAPSPSRSYGGGGGGARSAPSRGGGGARGGGGRR